MPSHAGPFPCFLVEPTNFVRLSARRFSASDGDDTSADPCPVHGYHTAKTAYRVYELQPGEDYLASEHVRPHTPLPFPRLCACGYEFQDPDPWQRFTQPLWRLPEELPDQVSPQLAGERLPLDELPVGAVYLADWYQTPELCVVCPRNPDGTGTATWNVDAPSASGRGWARTGTPPLVTASPSIFIDAPRGWHGWLRDGVLVPV